MVLRKSPVWGILIGLLVISLACNTVTRALQGELTPVASQIPQVPAQGGEQPQQGQPGAQTAEVDYPRFESSQVYLAAFADYPAEYAKLPSSFQGGYSLPLDLASINGMENYSFSEKQSSLLAQNGFVVASPKAGEYREFYQIYESLRYDVEPVFVTTDAVYHVYHLIFDKMLRDLERQYFLPYLSRLTQSMIEATQKQYQELSGTALEEPARRNYAYFVVAGQVLGLPGGIPAEVADLAQPEVSAIESHAGPQISTIWNRADLPDDMRLIEDYSQYTARGHYTRDEGLTRYFKAMMWYGRLTFRIADAFETRRALLLVQALRKAPQSEGIPAQQLWDNIYSPTVFIVGKADDLSTHEYGVISDAVFGKEPDLKSFGDDGLLQKFTLAAKNLPPPQINSMWVWIWQDKSEVTPGMRFMGQRFTLDSYVFGQLIWRNVGTQEKPRDLPMGLDFFAALGSEEALNILHEMKQNEYENFDSQMQKVRGEVSNLKEDSWTQSLYWSWLYAFQPMINVKGSQYPQFMRTQAWQRRELNTVLGSWTELKHDTVLYAKQVMAEMGGGGEEKPLHGYVEPNPEAFGRLLALAKMTKGGLEARGLLDETTRGNLENLIDLLQFYKKASESLLAGEVLSDDDYWRITYFGGELEAITLAAADRKDENDRDLQDQKAALVTDVATGIDRILLEGIGQPTKIFIVLPDEPRRIATGAVFTQYEFDAPITERMTDEVWQAKVEAGDIPPLAGWMSSFVAP